MNSKYITSAVVNQKGAATSRTAVREVRKGIK